MRSSRRWICDKEPEISVRPVIGKYLVNRIKEKYLNKRAVGSRYETMAAKHLEDRGYRILERNFRCRMGEVDLIALFEQELATEPEKTIVFVEVKYRRDSRSGQPWEAVGYKKRKTICRVADYYRLTHGGLHGYSFRFDIISILGDEITWFQNAFPYTT